MFYLNSNLTDATGRNLFRVVGPAFIADTEGLDTLDLALGMLAAVDVGARVLARLLRRVSNQRGHAAALEAPDGVGASRLGTADVRRSLTLVHVDAEGSVGLEAGSAAARTVLAALCVVGAVKVRFASGPDIGGEASGSSVPLISGRTLASVSGNAIDALGTDAAVVERPGAAFVDVCEKVLLFIKKLCCLEQYALRSNIQSFGTMVVCNKKYSVSKFNLELNNHKRKYGLRCLTW